MLEIELSCFNFSQNDDISHFDFFFFRCKRHFESRAILADHFVGEHSSFYDAIFSDTSAIDAAEFKLDKFQTMKCSHCNFADLDENKVTTHRYKTHPEVLDKLLDKMSLLATLKPQTKTQGVDRSVDSVFYLYLK
jgi:hypothetical protein